MPNSKLPGPPDIFTQYLDYTEFTESPRIFHRWSAITAVGALLSRNVFIQLGIQGRIYPNLYVMLMGAAGTRKSSAIKLVKRTISAAGYTTFAADKTSKEKFLMDLAGMPEYSADAGFRTKNSGPASFDLDAQLFGGNNDEPKDVFIVADEFNEFAGAGNIEFFTTLGNLWDWDDPVNPFSQKFKNSSPVEIFQPTVSILSGNTAENFSRAFPAESQGIGFLSRLLLIHGERTGKKFWKPPIPEDSIRVQLEHSFRAILKTTSGGIEVPIEEEAGELLEQIYTGWEELDDSRFLSYASRRFTQLLKLCLIMSAGSWAQVISRHHVIAANTVLSAAELHMPKAMGEFGQAKSSPQVDKIMSILSSATKPLTQKDLFIRMGNDLEAQSKLADLMNKLVIQNKVQHIAGKGFLPRKEVKATAKFVDWSLLTEEERKDIGEV